MSQKYALKILCSLLIALCLVTMVLVAGASAEAVNQEAEVDLAIEMTAPKHVETIGSFVINISYSNVGNVASPAADTWVRLTIPSDTKYISATDKEGVSLPPDDIDGNQLTWVVGVIPADSCCRHILVTLELTAELPEESKLTSIAEIGSSAMESNLENNAFSITSEVCDMAGSTKQAQIGKVKPSTVVTYTLTIRMTQRKGHDEQGSHQVELTDVLPPSSQATFLGWTSTTTGIYDGNHLHWQGQVHPGEAVMLQYQLGILGEIPPGSVVTNRAHLNWEGGNMEMQPVEVEIYLTEDDHMFGPGGGQWQHQYGVTLEVPPNAVPATTRFEFKPLFSGEPPEELPPGWMFAHRAFELTAFQFGELHRFNQPITITIGYDEKDVDGLNRNTLRLWYRSGPGEPWAMLGEPVRHQNGQISFTTDHFTQFALMGQGAYTLLLPILMR